MPSYNWGRVCKTNAKLTSQSLANTNEPVLILSSQACFYVASNWETGAAHPSLPPISGIYHTWVKYMGDFITERLGDVLEQVGRDKWKELFIRSGVAWVRYVAHSCEGWTRSQTTLFISWASKPLSWSSSIMNSSVGWRQGPCIEYNPHHVWQGLRHTFFSQPLVRASGHRQVGDTAKAIVI